MPKKVELKVREIRWNRKFIWFFWMSKNEKRKRPLVKVKCIDCWYESVVLKEQFLKWTKCKKCFQEKRTKELADLKRTHWLWQTRFYHLYYTMKWRCKWTTQLWQKYYKDKWIKCLWNTFNDFKNDMYRSYLEHIALFWEKNTTIERIDNNKNYCKENCRWATIKEQKRNTSRNIFYDFNWVKLCEQDIIEITHEKKSAIRKKYVRI